MHPPSTFVIRPATESELPAMLAIYNDAIRNTTSSYHYEPRSEAQWQEWYRGKIESKMPVFVAMQEDELLGWSTYGIFRGAWAGYRFSVEHSLYVRADQRRRGIGKALLQGLIETARSERYHTLIAGVDSTNEASLRLHRALGFFDVAHFRQVGYKFDRWLDLIFLQLMLE